MIDTLTATTATPVWLDTFICQFQIANYNYEE